MVFAAAPLVLEFAELPFLSAFLPDPTDLLCGLQGRQTGAAVASNFLDFVVHELLQVLLSLDRLRHQVRLQRVLLVELLLKSNFLQRISEKVTYRS